MRRIGLIVTAAVGIGLGLVGNLAAGTVSVPQQWRAGIWVATALLAGGAVVGTVRNQGAPRRDRKAFAAERRRYLTRLVERYQRLDLEVLTPAVADENGQVFLRPTFVAQHVRAELPPIEVPPQLRRRLIEAGAVASGELQSGMDADLLTRARETYLRQPARPVLRVLCEPEQRRTVLLGDPGAGKSTLARYVVLTLALGASSHPDGVDLAPLARHLPFLIELREFAEARWRGYTFLDYLDHLHTTEGLGLPKESLAEHLSSGAPAVVIFDGLDELFDPATRETVARQIAAFASRYPGVRVVVTTRIIGYRRTLLESAGFVHHTLQDLSIEQIEQFAGQWYAHAGPGDPAEAARRRERLIRAVRESAPIRDLAGNPMLLTILSIIGRRQELPRARKEVYQHAVSVLVEHWDVNKYLDRANADAPFISRADRLELLRRIARHMQGTGAGPAGNALPGAELVAEFETYLRDRYQLTRDRSAPAAESMLAQFRDRNFILSRFGGEVYGFVHRAFLEYLCAADIVHRFQVEHAWSSDELASEVFGRHYGDPSWQEVLLLVAGMIDGRDTGNAIRHLLTANPLWAMHPNEPPYHLMFAIRCLGEVDRLDLVAVEAHALLDAVTSTLEIIEDSVDDDPDQDFTVEGLEALRRAIAPTFASIGTHWPERDRFLTWYTCFEPRMRGRFPDGIGRVRLAAAALLAHLFADDEPVLDLLRTAARFDIDGNGRAVAIEAIATAWHHDPRTLPFICAQVTDDDTLYTVVEMLAAHWPGNAAALTFIRQHACSSDTWYIRGGAVQALASGWPDDADVLPFIQNRATSDDHWDARLSAVHALARVWRTDPTTRTLLHNRAVEDDDAAVRTAAVQALAAGWPDDPQTIRLAYDRADGDADADVRKAAIRTLAAIRGDTPRILPFLRDRAATDPDATVRAAAVQALAAGWRDDPQLLPLLRGRVAADQAGNARAAAVRALAERGARDPGTPNWLREWTADDDSIVRTTAARALASDWHDDPQTLPTLGRLADGDPDATVRAAALHAVVAGWPAEAVTLNTVRRAVTDAAPRLRRAAIRALAARWRDELRTLQLINGRATEDEDWSVRRCAVRALAGGWYGDPQVLPLIHDRIHADRDWRVRQAAVRALTVGWRDEPSTLPLVRERATEDEDWGIRQAAARLMTAGWPHDPRTMPLVHTVATDDPNDKVRQTALQTIAMRWPDDRWTLRLVHDRAATDDSAQVRLMATLILKTRNGLPTVDGK